MNFRILDLDELQGRNCVEGYLENDQLPSESSSKVTRATFRLEVTVSLEKVESICSESFDEPIFVSPFIGTPEKHCHRRQCYCIDDCMVTSELTISVYPGIIIRWVSHHGWLSSNCPSSPLNRPKFPDNIFSFTGMNQLSVKGRLQAAKQQAKTTMTDILADFYIDDLTDDLSRISFLSINPIIAINEPFDSDYFRVIFEWVFRNNCYFMAGICSVVSRFDHDNRPWFSSNPIK